MSRLSYMEQQVPTSKKDVPYADYLTLINSLMLHGCEAFCGKYTGTGASLDVLTPFDPGVVIVYDHTQLALTIKLPTLLTDVAAQMILAVAEVTAAITLGTGKFTLGTNAGVNTAADVCHFIAFGVRPTGGGS